MSPFDEHPALPFLQSGKIIHFSKDDYGCVLVIDDGKRRILNFDSPFEQSCMQICHPHQLVHQYTRFMALAVAFIDPAHITFLGLGGGSLLRTLHYALPECTFHVIELRQTVVEVANEYFSVPRDHRVNICVDDAVKQITKTHSNSSDIIFSDMYDAYRMAPGQIQKSFLRECARVLTDQGFLVINLHKLPTDQFAFFEMLDNIFPTVMINSTTENVVIFASKAGPEKIESNIQRVESIEEQLHQRLAHLLGNLIRL
ncbi:spermidine synthase [Nitrincola sp. MINF-07-Sa-05]|uniref:spermidine synthase n=1 Tax=Nitrincola salilacus TaxID=3400273 RepID=UPI00391850F8